MDLGRFGLLSRDSAVGLGSSGFGEENPPSDPLESAFRGEDSPPTVIGVRSAGFRVGPDGLSGWVGFWFLVDSPNEYIVAINFLLLQHIYHYIKAVIKISSDYCNEIFCYTKLPQNLLQQHTSTIAMILMLLQ